MLVESDLDEPIEGARHDPLLRGDGADAQQQDNRGGIERVDPLVIERIEDQRP